MIIDRHGQVRVIDNDTIVVAPLDLDLQRTAYRWQLSADQWAVFLRAYCMHRQPQLTEKSARFWRLRAVALSAAFRVTRGLTSATAPLAELTKLVGDTLPAAMLR